MGLRALTKSLAVATATTGLIACGIGTAAAVQPGSTPSGAAASGTGAAAAASSNTSVRVNVVVPMPRDIVYRDGGYYRGNERLPLPAGYRERGGDIYGPDGVALAPISKHEDVVSVPVACKGGLFEFSPVTTTNWIGNIINGAFNAARAGVEAAAGIAQAAVGAASTPGAKC